MSLRNRIKRLERTIQPKGSCPECGGKGHFSCVVLEYGEEPPPGGCPKCGEGSQVVIKPRLPTVVLGVAPKGAGGSGSHREAS